MFVDVLKRYLLIVWNFFFGQGSTDSIQDSPKDQPAESADTVPSTEVDKDDNVSNEEVDDDDIEEIYDDEEEDGDDVEEEDDVEDDEDVKVVAPKKPDVKTVTDDVPAKPSPAAVKVEEVKVVPDAPSVKKPESPKVDDVEVKEKQKNDVDDTKTKESSGMAATRKEEAPRSKPEFEMVEREDPRAAAPAKDAAVLKKPEFEILERETSTKHPAKDANQEFEIVEKEALKSVPGKEDAAAETLKAKEVVAPKVAVSEKDDAAAAEVKPPKDDAVKKTAHVKFEDEVVKGGDAAEEQPPKETVAAASRPIKADDVVKVPAVTKDQPAADKGPAHHQGPAAETISNFVVLEKGEGDRDDGDLPKTTGRVDTTIDSFLLGEQRHSNGAPHRPETSIQDQQLEYSDSGEELSDDDIEIDYEDDEDDEEVEEVKPLPPVARSVYKKND